MATLIVGRPAGDCAQLRGVLEEMTQDISEARDCREAIAVLRRHPARVVICERDLPDGSWRDVLEAISGARAAPRLIVTSRLADEHLWAEALNLGAYDVLAQPFETDEVRRVIRLAARVFPER